MNQLKGWNSKNMHGSFGLLHHIAIAVSDLESAMKVYGDLGVQFSHETEIVAEQGVKVSFGKIDVNAHLELICPLEEGNSIGKFIQKNGPGIHHICFRVHNLDEKCRELKERGYKLIYDNPVRGANHSMVNFIHPKSAQGVLIEIMECQAPT